MTHFYNLLTSRLFQAVKISVSVIVLLQAPLLLVQIVIRDYRALLQNNKMYKDSHFY
jgi:hypothetical protein